MKFELDIAPADKNQIRSYRRGAVTVNEEDFHNSLIVTPDRLLRDWPPRGFDSLEETHFRILLTLEPECVILGTGGQLRFPASGILSPLASAGIGVEVMDTGAACRSYNVLASEGRRVAAALLMIE